MDEDAIDRARCAKRGSPFLNTDQAAYFLAVSRRHLERLRTMGGGPKCRRHSRIIHYHIDDLVAWSEAAINGAEA
jgi:hypothetical protein